MKSLTLGLPKALPLTYKPWILLAVFTLAGCARLPRSDISEIPATPAVFKAAMPDDAGSAKWTIVAPSDAEPRGDWWLGFGDPVLNGLMQRALSRNTSISISMARLAQARAFVRSADAERLPQLALGAGASRGTVAGRGPSATSLFSLGASTAWEIDVAERLSLSSRAADLDAQSREALLVSTRLLVQAEVAQAYLTIRFADREREVVRETASAYKETLALTRRRFRAGDVAELDLARVQSEAAATDAEAFAVDRQRAGFENALAILLGETASTFSLPSGERTADLPSVPGGLPSSMLARRPDVAAAQRGLLAAQARVGIAEAAWFPSLALTANGGIASPELKDVLRWSARAWSVEALLSLPLFDGGRREARLDAAKAELEVALAEYRQQLLQALRETEDSLSDLQLLARQAKVQNLAVESAARATALSDSRYRNGSISQLDLLDARRSELRNRREALRVEAAQYRATVNLIRALGGGWAEPGRTAANEAQRPRS